MRFLTNQPALLIGKNLVIADLHFGIECEAGLASIALSRAKAMAQRIVELAKEHGAKRVVILGDVKHLLPKKEKFEFERVVAKAIPNLLSQIAAVAEVIVIKGNHDGGLVLHNFDLKKEMLLKDVLFVHGHRWPSAEVAGKCGKIICAHTHPCWAFVDAFGHRELKKVIILGRAAPGFFKKYKTKPRAIEVVVMPAFNDLIRGAAVNEQEMLGPLLKKGIFKASGVYLLDGTQIR